MDGCKDVEEVGLEWPEVCIGCGIDQGLKRYDTTVKLRKHVAIANFCDRASFYLCPPCIKKAMVEQRNLRARGVVTLVIVLAMGAMFTLATNPGTENNAGILPKFALIGFFGLLISQAESIWLFAKRQAFHSYYDFGISGFYAKPQFIFRNKIYAELFRIANPEQQSIHFDSFRIAARPTRLLMSFGFIGHSAFAAIILFSIMGAIDEFAALTVLFWLLFTYAAVWWYRRFHVDYFISS